MSLSITALGNKGCLVSPRCESGNTHGENMGICIQATAEKGCHVNSQSYVCTVVISENRTPLVQLSLARFCHSVCHTTIYLSSKEVIVECSDRAQVAGNHRPLLVSWLVG